MPHDKPWIDAPPPPPDLEKARRRARTALALASTPLLLWGACTARIVDPNSDAIGIAMLVVFTASMLGGALGIASLAAKRTPLGWFATFAGFLSPFLAFFLGMFTIPFSRGRAHRRRGAATVPHDAASDTWLDTHLDAADDAPRDGAHGVEASNEPTLDPTTRGVAIDAPTEHREALATAWRAMAATETASVAAFASFAQQLLALGAPSRFVEDAHRDAIDEVRHARTCYGVAARLDGRKRGPAPFPAAAWPSDHAPSFLRLARDTLRDGCVFEGASAEVAHQLASLEGACPATRRALAAIARDEARHAKHAWEVLTWARAHLTPSEDASLDAVLDEVLRSRHDAVVDHDRFEPFGVAGPTRWRDAVREAATHARARLQKGRAALATADAA